MVCWVDLKLRKVKKESQLERKNLHWWKKWELQSTRPEAQLKKESIVHYLGPRTLLPRDWVLGCCARIIRERGNGLVKVREVLLVRRKASELLTLLLTFLKSSLEKGVGPVFHNLLELLGLKERTLHSSLDFFRASRAATASCFRAFWVI